MKKIFTLALAAAATLGASAFEADFTQAPQLSSRALSNAAQISTSDINLEPIMTRADDPNGLAGTYQSGMMLVVLPGGAGPGSQPDGIYTQSNGTIEIVADANRTNGYIIKGLFSDFIYGSNRNPNQVTNDIPATWDAVYRTLTCDAYPELATIEGETLHLIAAENGTFGKENHLTFTRSGAALGMTSQGISFGYFEGDDYYAFPYQVLSLNNVVANGTFTYTNVENVEMTDWVCAYENQGFFYIFNFGGTSALNRAVFAVEEGQFVCINGSIENPIPSGYIRILDEESGLNIDADVYCSYANENGQPEVESDWFELAGEIITGEGNNYEVTFPLFGLFDASDVCYGLYSGGVLKFDMSNFAGIENVAATTTTDAPVVYYNLQGMRVNNPQNGIFIRVQGSDVEKMMIK